MATTQTRLESFIESFVNVLSGLIISLFFWTLVRGYLWRRFFDKGLHKVVHGMVLNAKES